MQQFNRFDTGAYVGYMWADRNAIEPLYQFYANLNLDCWDHTPDDLNRHNWGDIYND